MSAIPAMRSSTGARRAASTCYEIHKVAGRAHLAVCAFRSEGEVGRLEFANLPHDVAETLELVFVSITIVASLALLVLFGQWWQR